MPKKLTPEEREERKRWRWIRGRKKFLQDGYDCMTTAELIRHVAEQRMPLFTCNGVLFTSPEMLEVFQLLIEERVGPSMQLLDRNIVGP